jgi:hypothetical protein
MASQESQAETIITTFLVEAECKELIDLSETLRSFVIFSVGADDVTIASGLYEIVVRGTLDRMSQNAKRIARLASGGRDVRTD